MAFVGSNGSGKSTFLNLVAACSSQHKAL
ncbi:hypothetical protein [Allobaculum sp. JKK-2023]